MDASARIVRFLSNRPRIFIGVAIGLIAFFLEPWHFRPIQRALFAWDVGMWSYLVLIWIRMVRASPEDVQRVAEREDEGATTVLAIITAAAIASLVAIVVELSAAKGLGPKLASLNYALTAVTMIGGWLLIPTVFTLEYARYYHQAGEGEASLKFPDPQEPLDYWDFMYFAFTIAVASQTSDVSVCSRRARRTALAQSILSFFFNAAVLGLCVNIAAGLLGS
ncbi:DUF1345 domain-containing protein [Trinickia dabaoshanensis]|uniref:DUF1345 domain-containing protein n=1 Tax=Trinickia dabaoshanensis TaxID=564714 RepID=A0A2N7VJ93_9BURK|nr:DUF1345 domain-containing protein [Trinickia dabaoshanensis]PMS17226.1 DUF1345 domain-containing protein [Trinickia dabaoshanensis]